MDNRLKDFLDDLLVLNAGYAATLKYMADQYYPLETPQFIADVFTEEKLNREITEAVLYSNDDLISEEELDQFSDLIP